MPSTTTTAAGKTATGMPSLKDLASSEPSLRRRNLAVVLEYLSEGKLPSPPPSKVQQNPSQGQDQDQHQDDWPTQCLQLWRGLSVALYMHDTKKMVVVQQLIATLAGTVDVMYARDRERSRIVTSKKEKKTKRNGIVEDEHYYYYTSTWTNAFWETMAREWSGLDQWRINKYLLLVRLVLRAQLGLIVTPHAQDQAQRSNESSHGDDGLLLFKSQMDILEKWPLSTGRRSSSNEGKEKGARVPVQVQVPDGLRLHVLDIWVEEVDRAAVNAQKDGDEKEEKGEGESKSKKRKRGKDKNQDDDEDSNNIQENEKEKEKEEREKEKKEMVDKLILPIRRLAKEALGKGVKIKAKEIVREIDGESD